jgi:poly(3-hydroxyalkanoate) depolymerase
MSLPLPAASEPSWSPEPRPASLPWRKYKLRVGGEALRVAERGDGGTPLLLINGIGAHLDMWAPFERLLGARRLIAFDLPGCGESTLSAVPRRMKGLADLVGELIDLLSYPEVDALGYSFGGALAQEVAHRRPDRVRRLILCGTSPGMVSVPPKPLPALFLLTPARYYHPAFFRFMMPRIVGGRTAHDPRALDEQVDVRLAHPPALRGYLYQLCATTGWTSIHYLHQLKQPTLVLAGDDDRAIPLANARLLAHRIPNARLHVVVGAGHAFLLDEPESVVDEIEAFLDER